MNNFSENIAQENNLMIASSNNQQEQQADQTADNIMRMPESSFVQRKCTACEHEEEKVSRKTEPFIQKQGNGSEGGIASESVTNQINTSRGGGNKMSENTLSFMESRFNTGFSGVKIHTDSNAVQMSRELNAQAFTVGSDIYFNEGKYSPESASGKHLLAHELTHTVQQGGGIDRKIQRACYEESNPSINMGTCPEGSVDVGRQPQGQTNAIDAKAQAIITLAADTTIPIADRAMRVVNDIICTYMPTQASKVRKITFFASESGLHTQGTGNVATSQGDICVGENFVNNTTRAFISRRVLQVAHELQHIDQQRTGIGPTGLGGGTRSDLREFLAFTTEALADEFIGTRRMPNATRLSLIDGAIGYYYCLSADQKTQYSTELLNLTTRRATVNGVTGNTAISVPTSCHRQ
jgi:Domain of unknown function (DUF4157)